MEVRATANDERRGYRIAEAALYMGVTPWFVELKIRSASNGQIKTAGKTAGRMR
jgi:hypothetical protein